MASELRLLDDAYHLVELFLMQAQLELALGRIDHELAHLALAIEAVQLAIGGRGQVEGRLEGADDAMVAVCEAVLEMVERGEVEDVIAVPSARLDADGVVDAAELLELAGADDDLMLRDERDMRSVVRPDLVLDRRRRHLGDGLTLLDVKEGDAVVGAEQHRAGARREEHVRRGVRWRTLLGYLVLEILDEDLPILVEDRKALPGDEDSRGA
mmetsp:Transcript_85968/g.171668  ORF Transcript_85968/g.171668 Transcript_85968/m.171668 type:complete len:212 (+) Transcript_85968:2345-2980(+)